jgi:hypothetical protein
MAFFMIGKERYATQELVGVVVFLLPLEVQRCSLAMAVTYNILYGNTLDIETSKHRMQFVLEGLTMIVGDPSISTLA